MKTQRIAQYLGAGILAGAAGTAAITASQTVEMLFTGRPPSDSPARAAEKVVGILPKDDKAKARLANLVHWAYGTSWGLFRALAAALGVRGASGDALHFGAVQLAAATLLPAIGIAPPLRQWKRRDLAVEMAHHFIYALGAGFVFGKVIRSGRSKAMALFLLSALAPAFLLEAGDKQVTRRSEGRPRPRREIEPAEIAALDT